MSVPGSATTAHPERSAVTRTPTTAAPRPTPLVHASIGDCRRSFSKRDGERRQHTFGRQSSITARDMRLAPYRQRTTVILCSVIPAQPDRSLTIIAVRRANVRFRSAPAVQISPRSVRVIGRSGPDGSSQWLRESVARLSAMQRNRRIPRRTGRCTWEIGFPLQEVKMSP
jgi:hypothetical protein